MYYRGHETQTPTTSPRNPTTPFQSRRPDPILFPQERQSVSLNPRPHHRAVARTAQIDPGRLPGPGGAGELAGGSADYQRQGIRGQCRLHCSGKRAGSGPHHLLSQRAMGAVCPGTDRGPAGLCRQRTGLESSGEPERALGAVRSNKARSTWTGIVML